MGNKPVTIDQEGKECNPHEIAQSRFNEVNTWFRTKLPEFVKALKERCEKENEVFVDMGYDPRLQRQLYQVGIAIYGIECTPDCVRWDIVGQIR